MDLLSTVLQSLRLIDSSVGLFEMGGPWGFQLAAATPGHVFVFYPLTSPLHLEVPGEAPLLLQPGDTALVLGTGFTMASSPEVHPLPLTELWAERRLPPLGPRVQRTGAARLRWNATGPASGIDRVLTLALLLEDVQQSPVLGVLPRCIVLRSGATRLYPWWDPVMRFIDIESGCADGVPGYDAAARLLAQLTFVEMVRTYALTVEIDKASWLKGITDAQVGRALGLIYGEPMRDWRLDTLASACGMARSTFSRRFTALVGCPPMEYLGQVRLHQAARQLAAGERVGQVAASIGYQSEWAFRRAFTLQFGTTPNRYRQGARGGCS